VAEVPSKPFLLPYHCRQVIMDSTNRKIFWILFTILSLGGYFLPFAWAVAEMFVSIFVSWWIVYRSGLI
jgi:hypothetical protein